MGTNSYRNSHLAEDKPAAYDQCFMEPRQKYLWSREQMALSDFLDRYLKGRRINCLDFACGTGRITSFIENCVDKSTAVDVSRPMLDKARQKLSRTELIHADITKENVLLGRKFDLITAFRFFLNAEPKLRINALKTLSGLLAEDGFIVFNNHRNRTSPLVWIRQLYYHRIRKNYQANFMSMGEVKQLVSESGLNIVRIYPVGSFPIPKIRFSNKLNSIMHPFTSRLRCLDIFSESPIVVCQHRLQTQCHK